MSRLSMWPSPSRWETLETATRCCPACGGRGIFHRWFTMAERCPTCDLLFERVEGHWIGSLGTNTTVTFGLMLIVVLSVSLIAYPDPVVAEHVAWARARLTGTN